MRTLRDRPDVSVVFMRLPDGFPLGTGSAMYDYQSLRRLVDGAISDIEAVDGSQTYSWDDLVETLSELMSDFDPSDIHTLDYVGSFDDGDHSDHHAAAFVTQAASDDHDSPHTLYSHQGYGTRDRPENVTGEDLDRKTEAYLAYVPYDEGLDPEVFEDLLPRQYVLDETT